ncbi:MAG: hypothetical protein KF869_05205 [Phycisphaeraceae bacterium]|nr:hypothetical protein [Phycisphaeraceae bacterium]
MHTKLGAIAVALATGAATGVAQAQCGASGKDLLLTDVTAVTNYTPSPGGIDAASFGSLQTNVGSTALTSNIFSALHPVQAPNLYRLITSSGVSRFEQIGMGWAFHAGVPLNQAGFCTCEGGGGTSIGPGCSDPHTATSAGSAMNLGPRWQVNAASGALTHPYTAPSGTNAGRLQFAVADVTPALNPGAAYFAELIVVHAEDAGDGNALNNASVRPVLTSLAGDNPVISLSGATSPGVAAIQLWKDLVPGVVEAFVDVAGDGRFIVAARAVRLGGNQWDYEYAVFNLNSHRSAKSFTVQMPPGAAAVTPGFHDVSYHSGDGPGGATIVGTDWAFAQSADAAAWQTDDFAVDEAANALRWGTMYNFRLRGGVSPDLGEAVIGLFRPGSPEAVAAVVPVPARPSCLADHDGNGHVEVADIFAFLGDWFAGLPAGDALGDGGNGVPDIFAFLAAWFSGC